MKRGILCVAFALLLPASTQAQASGRDASRSSGVRDGDAGVISDAVKATVTIVTIDAAGDTLGQGSGFIVRPDGAIVTNWHVMRGASSAVVTLADGERYDRVEFLDGDRDADIAIIKVPGYQLPTLKTRSTVPEVGEHIITIGSPLGFSQTVSEGIVSALRIQDGREVVQISAPISPGSSGGAVLDGAGRVFAISTSYVRGGQQLNFAVPVKYALGLLAANPMRRPLNTALGGSDSEASSRSEALARPAPSHSPVPELAGTFAVKRRWTGPRAAPDRQAQMGLIIAGRNVGFLVDIVRAADSTLDFAKVYSMNSLRTNVDGQVVLDAGGVVLDGFQTDGGGFFVTGTVERSGAVEDSLRLRAEPLEVKLSWSTGLYSVSCKTRYIGKGGRSAGSFDWTGEMAVLIANDSIHVNLYLTNKHGGSSGLYGQAPLADDGSFEMTASSPAHEVSLSGTVHAGVLKGKWEDRRKGGKFAGPIRAERK